MAENPMDPWREWLDAEEGGRLDEADALFGTVARHWPRTAVRAEVVARLAAAARPPVRTLWQSRRLRAALGAAVAATGIALGAVSTRAFWGLLLGVVTAVATAIDHTLALVHAWVGMVLSLSGTFARVAQALADALSEPRPLLFLVVNVLVASAALAALRRLLSVREV